MSVTVTTDEYRLEPSQIDSFATDGHVLLRRVATGDEIAKYRPAIRQACLAHTTENRSLESRDTYGKAFLQVTNLWTRDETVRRFVFMRKFASIASRLLNVPHVRLYHDQALFKEPGGGPTPWHRDQFYWPLDTDQTITMWMPMVDVDSSMGTMRFASGSHERRDVGAVEISDESQETYDKYIREKGFSIASVDSINAGDATFHLGRTVHSAGANGSDKMREVMTVIYFADGARVSRPQSAYQQADLDAWLDGLPPGAIAAGPLNPILA